MTTPRRINRRLLIVDDNESIHHDFRQILGSPLPIRKSLESSKKALLGSAPKTSVLPTFEIDSAYQGQDGCKRVSEAIRNKTPYAAAFIDVRMPPGWDGIETAAKILKVDKEIQIVICTAFSDYTLDDILARFGMQERLMLLRKPFEVVETCLLAVSLTEKWRLTHDVNQRLERQSEQILDTRRVMSVIDGCLGELETAHGELRQHTTDISERLQQKTVELLGTRDVTMFALAQLADSRDPETGEHLLRMRAYAQLIANYLAENGPYVDQIDEKYLQDFYRSTPLHDIGKVGIPDQILLKPGPLTSKEFEVMKRHTIIGAHALEKAAHQNCYGDFLAMAAEIALTHHEKFDGSGYPHGLRGKDIPLAGRMTALADVFDALTSARIYKDAMTAAEARHLIKEEMNGHFDPAVLSAFDACYREFIEVKQVVDSGASPAVAPLPAFETDIPRLIAALDAV